VSIPVCIRSACMINLIIVVTEDGPQQIVKCDKQYGTVQFIYNVSLTHMKF